jgi:putative endonuclease
MKKDLKKIGKIGENFAVKYLKDNNFEILELNYLVWGGEIDIIAFKNNTFHIAEVKTSQSHIKPEDHINRKKMLKVAKTAEYYINYKQTKFNKDGKMSLMSFRLDIILVQIDKAENLISLKYLPDFEL